MALHKHTVVFYGLSTCIHCKRAKEFLEQCEQPFEHHFVDLATGEERARLLAQVREYNPGMSFPVTVIDGVNVIVGYRPEAMAEALEL